MHTLLAFLHLMALPRLQPGVWRGPTAHVVPLADNNSGDAVGYLSMVVIPNIFEFNYREAGGEVPSQESPPDAGQLFSQLAFALAGLPAPSPVVVLHVLPDP